jgi:hypothetical protein
VSECPKYATRRPESEWETFKKLAITCKDTKATTAAGTPCEEMKA